MPYYLPLIIVCCQWGLALCKPDAGGTTLQHSRQYWMPAFSNAGLAVSGFYRLIYWRDIELLPTADAKDGIADAQLSSTAAYSWLSNRCRSRYISSQATDKADNVQLLDESHLQKAASMLLWSIATPSTRPASTSNAIVNIVPVAFPRLLGNRMYYSRHSNNDSTNLAFLHVSPGRIGIRFTSIGRASWTICTVRDADSSAQSLLSRSKVLFLLLAPAAAALALSTAAAFVCCSWQRTVRQSLNCAAANASASAATAVTATSALNCSSDHPSIHCGQYSQLSFAVPPPLSIIHQQQQQQRQRCLPRARSTPYPINRPRIQMQTLGCSST